MRSRHKATGKRPKRPTLQSSKGHEMKSTGRLILAALLMLGVTGCATFVVRSDATPCSTLIPTQWALGVPDDADPPEHAALPAGSSWQALYDDAIVALKEWTGFGVAQTRNLRAANGRTADAINLIARCEARDAAALKAAARPKLFGR